MAPHDTVFVWECEDVAARNEHLKLRRVFVRRRSHDQL
jgi:hypothetical protein